MLEMVAVCNTAQPVLRICCRAQFLTQICTEATGTYINTVSSKVALIRVRTQPINIFCNKSTCRLFPEREKTHSQQ